MGLRQWLGERFVRVGVRLLGVGADVPIFEDEETAEEERGPTAFIEPRVELSPAAIQMLEEGRNPPLVKLVVREEIPLKGSAAERIASARARYEMGNR